MITFRYRHVLENRSLIRIIIEAISKRIVIFFLSINRTINGRSRRCVFFFFELFPRIIRPARNTSRPHTHFNEFHSCCATCTYFPRFWATFFILIILPDFFFFFFEAQRRVIILKSELNENRRRRSSSLSREGNPTFFPTPVSLAKTKEGRMHLSYMHACKYTRRCTAHKYVGQRKNWKSVRNAKEWRARRRARGTREKNQGSS